jgi:hypothetical protein
MVCLCKEGLGRINNSTFFGILAAANTCGQGRLKPRWTLMTMMMMIMTTHSPRSSIRAADDKCKCISIRTSVCRHASAVASCNTNDGTRR